MSHHLHLLPTLEDACQPFRIMLCMLAMLLLAPAELLAQPNPFETYEMERASEPDPAPTVQPTPPATVPAVVARDDALWSHAKAPGQWTMGITGAYNLSFAQNALLEGGDANNSTFFARLSPTVGYFILERFELGASLGLFVQRLQRQDSSSAVRNYWFEATASYHIPMSRRLTFLPALGLGGYLGSSNRTLNVEQTNANQVDELTRTRGGSLALYLGLEYALKPELALDFNIHTLGLLGSESIKSEEARLKARSINSGVGVGLKYFF